MSEADFREVTIAPGALERWTTPDGGDPIGEIRAARDRVRGAGKARVWW